MGSNSSKYESESDSDEESIPSPDSEREYTPPPPRSFETLPDISLKSAPLQLIKLKKAKIGKFRLIDCVAYCNDNKIRIMEFQSVAITKRIAYAVISYVWKGNHTPEDSKSFNVVVSDDAKSGDRISIDVLRMACKAALFHGVLYIWLDRLCIIQDNFEDVKWQMSVMSDIYRDACYCFVLPGGIGGLVKPEEKTTWIHRSWTLMEALSPREVWCIFRWRRGPGTWYGVKNYSDVEELEKGYCAMTRLEAVLALSRTRVNFADENQDETYFLPFGASGSNLRNLQSIKMVLFSSEIQPITALGAARSSQQLAQRIRKKAQPLTTEDHWRLDSAETAIWRCAVMRTSQYEYDVVYSIMGLFDVNITYDKTKTRDQLIIELCSQTLRNGGKANWFAASMSLPVPQIFCTMPPTPVMGGGVPQVRASGETFKPAHEFMGLLDWFFKEMPKVKITEDAVIEFSAPMSPVKQITVPKDILDSAPRFKFVFTVANISCGVDGTSHIANLGGNMGTHAVNLGRTLPYVHFGLDK